MDFNATAATSPSTDGLPESRSQLPLTIASSPVLPSEEPDMRQQCAPTSASGYVALSRFTVARMTDQVKHAFQQRPHRVDSASGFLRMEVLSPCDAPDEIWLVTYWKDEHSYRSWHHSHLYKESHQGIPKGMRLAPKSVSIRFFEHVAS